MTTRHGIGDVARRQVQESRATYLGKRTPQQQSADVAALAEYQRLRELNPFDAARFAAENHTALEGGHMFVDAMREANPDQEVNAADFVTKAGAK